MLLIIGAGFATLAALTIVIAYAADRRARDSAWRRIATSRRINAERTRELDERAEALLFAEVDRRERRIELREHLLSAREEAMTRIGRDALGQVASPEGAGGPPDPSVGPSPTGLLATP